VTRRGLLLKLVQRKPDLDPNFVLELNTFAEHYDLFVKQFNSGVLDTRLWEQLCRRGQTLFGKHTQCA
jgi:hypothetical protein